MMITTAAPALVMMRISGDWSKLLMGTLQVLITVFVKNIYLVDSVALNNFGP